MYGLLKIFWGICFATVPFGCGFSLLFIVVGLFGILLTLTGFIDAMRSLGSLLETPSTPPRPQDRP
jgi:hypothetical protein